MNTHGEKQSVVDQKPLLQKDSVAFIKAAKFIKDGGKMTDIEKKYRLTKQIEKALTA